MVEVGVGTVAGVGTVVEAGTGAGVGTEAVVVGVCIVACSRFVGVGCTGVVECSLVVELRVR